MMFLRNDPRCIPDFIEHTRRIWKDSFTEGGALSFEPQLVHEYEINVGFISELVRKSPQSAVSLLHACTGQPHCESPARHPIPSKINFAKVLARDTSLGSMFSRLTNPTPRFLSFYKA